MKYRTEHDRPHKDAGLLISRADEETLVADGRATLSPSQHVEQKLIGLLKASPLMVSQVQRRMRPGPR
jgi:hypothetical protein